MIKWVTAELSLPAHMYTERVGSQDARLLPHKLTRAEDLRQWEDGLQRSELANTRGPTSHAHTHPRLNTSDNNGQRRAMECRRDPLPCSWIEERFSQITFPLCACRPIFQDRSP